VRPVNVSTIGDYIREQREQARISLRQLAQAAGVSNPYLSQIERGLRKPSAEILQQIAKGLRISAEALYVQAGFLEDRNGDTRVKPAVLSDPYLTERQKQVLIDIYESFRRSGEFPEGRPGTSHESGIPSAGTVGSAGDISSTDAAHVAAAANGGAGAVAGQQQQPTGEDEPPDTKG
jgi:transcriptional regulator with XRE-family HTH domain